MKPDPGSTTQRKHIFEIDLIRAITVFSVVAIHSLAYTKNLTPEPLLPIYNLIGHALHYNREIFIFVTGLVLTYVYMNRRYSKKQFWLKRAGLVVIPYVVWSIIYVILNHQNMSVSNFLKVAVHDILTGNASFQLYYILLTIQLYILFPLFLAFIKKVAARPWLTLGISLILQIVFLYYNFHFLQSVRDPSPFLKTFLKYQDRIAFVYQFFFFLGAYTAIYFDRVSFFLKKYGKWVFGSFFISLVLYSAYYYYQLNQLNLSIWRATTVLQPSVALYSIVVIAFVGWLSLLWAQKRQFYSLIHVLSETSFGIYFVHVLFLSWTTKYILPLFPNSLSFVVKDFFVMFAAFSASVLFCYILLKIPHLSWTIGRARSIGWVIFPQSIRKKVTLSRVLSKKTMKVFVIFGGFLVLQSTGGRLAHINFPSVSSFDSFGTVANHITSSEIINQPIQSSGCAKMLQFARGKTSRMQILSDGVTRNYWIFIPKRLNNTTQHPLVLNFHGYASNPLRQGSASQFDRLAQKYRFVVVYPQGSQSISGARGWNTGVHPTIRTHDVLFVSDVLNQVQSEVCVNPRRIYATGFSNGAGFVNVLAYTLSNRIAAFAPVSGSYTTDFRTKTTRAVPLIEFHGTKDGTVPYTGNKKKSELGVTKWVQSWILEDKCRTSSKTIYQSKKIKGYSWQGCSNNASIVHYKLIGQNHTWPKMQYKIVINGKSKMQTTGDIIWSFFENHPLPPSNRNTRLQKI